jgi:hypothetical protein
MPSCNLAAIGLAARRGQHVEESSRKIDKLTECTEAAILIAAFLFTELKGGHHDDR